MHDERKTRSVSKHGARLTRKRQETAKQRATIYFVQCNGSDGPIKIGYAKSIDRRLSVLRNGCPYDLMLLGYAWVDDAEIVERTLHSRFASQRIHGEWFRCCDEILALARSVSTEMSTAILRSISSMLADASGQSRSRNDV